MMQKPLWPKTGLVVWIFTLVMLILFFLGWTQGITDHFFKAFFSFYEGRAKTRSVALKVQNCLGGKSNDELHKLFRSFDIDKDGDVSVSEFINACDSLELYLTDDEARHLMSRFDTDNTGRIDYKEFIRFSHGHEGLPTPPQSPRTLARLHRSKINPEGTTLGEAVAEKLLLPGVHDLPSSYAGWQEEQREQLEMRELEGIDVGLTLERKYELTPVLPLQSPPRLTELPALEGPNEIQMQWSAPILPTYAPLEL
jgi:hypothetical protein